MNESSLTADERYCLDNVRAGYRLSQGKPIAAGWWSPIAEQLVAKGLLVRIGKLDVIGSGKYVPAPEI